MQLVSNKYAICQVITDINNHKLYSNSHFRLTIKMINHFNMASTYEISDVFSSGTVFKSNYTHVYRPHGIQ